MEALEGVGWDHPRCVAPMLTASRARPEWGHLPVSWTFRSLVEFNSTPLDSLDALAAKFDLLVIDHLMVPRYSEVLIPLEDVSA